MVLRIIFLVVGIVSGIGWGLEGQGPLLPIVGAVVGAAVCGAIIWAEQALLGVPFTSTIGGALGLALGVVLAALLAHMTDLMVGSSSWISQFGSLVVFLALPYLGLVIGLRLGSEGWVGLLGSPSIPKESMNTLKLLDTSVIIDGRIADLCETGFIEGKLIVAQFILQELQHVSDSSDGLKRARGRRGLDVLNTIQKMVNVKVEIVEDDFPHVAEVDTKLVELAKKMDAKVLTNDWNLNKVAGLQGVRVLNINELCNALKPVVLPGETIRVFVLKEGKEAGQGVAYLDDGTMVVVDHAKRWIGKNVDVLVTSVLQTSAGRMIFTRLKEETEREELSFARV